MIGVFARVTGVALEAVDLSPAKATGATGATTGRVFGAATRAVLAAPISWPTAATGTAGPALCGLVTTAVPNTDADCCDGGSRVTASGTVGAVGFATVTAIA